MPLKEDIAKKAALTARDVFRRGARVKNVLGVSDDVESILEPHELDFDWRRARVPLESIYSDNQPYFDPERAAAIRGAKELPPIILRLAPDGRAELLDGSHRLSVARERGAQDIDALIGNPVEKAEGGLIMESLNAKLRDAIGQRRDELPMDALDRLKKTYKTPGTAFTSDDYKQASAQVNTNPDSRPKFAKGGDVMKSLADKIAAAIKSPSVRTKKALPKTTDDFLERADPGGKFVEAVGEIADKTKQSGLEHGTFTRGPMDPEIHVGDRGSMGREFSEALSNGAYPNPSGYTLMAHTHPGQTALPSAGDFGVESALSRRGPLSSIIVSPNSNTLSSRFSIIDPDLIGNVGRKAIGDHVHGILLTTPDLLDRVRISNRSRDILRGIADETGQHPDELFERYRQNGVANSLVPGVADNMIARRGLGAGNIEFAPGSPLYNSTAPDGTRVPATELSANDIFKELTDYVAKRGGYADGGAVEMGEGGLTDEQIASMSHGPTRRAAPLNIVKPDSAANWASFKQSMSDAPGMLADIGGALYDEGKDWAVDYGTRLKNDPLTTLSGSARDVSEALLPTTTLNKLADVGTGAEGAEMPDLGDVADDLMTLGGYKVGRLALGALSRAAKRAAPVVGAGVAMTPSDAEAGPLTELMMRARKTFGTTAARRLERAGDEIPNLLDQYSADALHDALVNGAHFSTINPADFEKYAARLRNGPFRPDAADVYASTNGKPQYHDVPFIELDRSGGNGSKFVSPTVRGHEGRHRMRALAQDNDKSLMTIAPRYEDLERELGADTVYREGIPNAVDEYLSRFKRIIPQDNISALDPTTAVTGVSRKIDPAILRALTLPMPEHYEHGGPVRYFHDGGGANGSGAATGDGVGGAQGGIGGEGGKGANGEAVGRDPTTVDFDGRTFGEQVSDFFSDTARSAKATINDMMNNPMRTALNAGIALTGVGALNSLAGAVFGQQNTLGGLATAAGRAIGDMAGLNGAQNQSNVAEGAPAAAPGVSPDPTATPGGDLVTSPGVTGATAAINGGLSNLSPTTAPVGVSSSYTPNTPNFGWAGTHYGLTPQTLT